MDREGLAPLRSAELRLCCSKAFVSNPLLGLASPNSHFAGAKCSFRNPSDRHPTKKRPEEGALFCWVADRESDILLFTPARFNS